MEERISEEESSNFSKLEDLLSQFNDELQSGKTPNTEDFLQRCPEEHRKKLCSLINTLLLANRALSPLRALVEDDDLRREEDHRKAVKLRSLLGM